MSDPNLARLRKAPSGCLGCLVLIVLCESFIASQGLKFTSVEHDDWRGAREISERGIAPGEVLFFGDSQVKYGISPRSVESRVGRPCHSLAIRGGQPPSSYFLLKHAIDSNKIPRAVVIDFEPTLVTRDRLFNRGLWSEVATIGQTFELAWPKAELDLFGENFVGACLPSSHNRYTIRDNILAALRGETGSLTSHLEVVHRNRSINHGGILMAVASSATQFEFARWANPSVEGWKPEPVNDDFARRFLKLARDHGIPVYCVLMPVVPGLQEKFERHGIEASYFAWLKELQRTNANLVILDWRHSGYGPSAFYDELHLNKAGSVSVGLAVGEFLKEDLARQAKANRWVQMPPFRLDGSENSLEDQFGSSAFVENQKRARANPAPSQIAVDPSRERR